MDEELIFLVRKYEALFNPKFVHYADYHIKMFLWKKVSNVTNRPTHLCILSWNKLVFLFLNEYKDIIKTLAVDSPAKSSDWNYFNKLNFLVGNLELHRIFKVSTDSTVSEDWCYNDGVAKFDSKNVLLSSDGWENKRFVFFEKYLSTLQQNKKNPDEMSFCERLFKMFYLSHFDLNAFVTNMKNSDNECRARLEGQQIENGLSIKVTKEVSVPCDSNIKTNAGEVRKRPFDDITTQLDVLNNNEPLRTLEKVSTWLETGSLVHVKDVESLADFEERSEQSEQSDESVDTIRYVLENKKRKLNNTSKTTIRKFAKAMNQESSAINSTASSLNLIKVAAPKKSIPSLNIATKQVGNLSPQLWEENPKQDRKKVRKTVEERNQSRINKLYAKSESSDESSIVAITKLPRAQHNRGGKSIKIERADPDPPKTEIKEAGPSNTKNDLCIDSSCDTYLIYAPGFQDLEFMVADGKVTLTTPLLTSVLGDDLTQKLLTKNTNLCLQYNANCVVVYSIKKNNLECFDDFDPPIKEITPELNLLTPLSFKYIYNDKELLEQMKKYPIMWDKFHEDHTSRKHHSKIWKNIADHFYGANINMLKSRWLLLKDEFAKLVFGDEERINFLTFSTTNSELSSDESTDDNLSEKETSISLS